MSHDSPHPPQVKLIALAYVSSTYHGTYLPFPLTRSLLDGAWWPDYVACRHAWLPCGGEPGPVHDWRIYGYFDVLREARRQAGR